MHIMQILLLLVATTGVHLALFPHLLREALRGRVGKQCSADSVSICCDSVGLSQHSPSKFQNFSTRQWFGGSDLQFRNPNPKYENGF